MLYELRVIPLKSSQQILDELAPAILTLLQFFNAAVPFSVIALRILEYDISIRYRRLRPFLHDSP
jgi:hypothetical protein